jgi:hypothetical protein
VRRPGETARSSRRVEERRIEPAGIAQRAQLIRRKAQVLHTWNLSGAGDAF